MSIQGRNDGTIEINHIQAPGGRAPLLFRRKSNMILRGSGVADPGAAAALRSSKGLAPDQLARRKIKTG